jgi:hypothetical protein
MTRCDVCRQRLDPAVTAEGRRTHPACDPRDHDCDDYHTDDESGYIRICYCSRCGATLQVGGRIGPDDDLQLVPTVGKDH